MATKLPLDSVLQNVSPERHAPARGPLKPFACRQGAAPMLAGHGKELGVSRLGTRRIMTREQGRALEMIGHAVDYLNDFYVQNGPDNEILDFRNSPSADAVRLLIEAQRHLFRELPLAEPLSARIWNRLFRRKRSMRRAMPQDVVPLSSAR